MFKDMLKKTYLMFNKVKVVHSIPGRIRLLIPSLDKFPEQMKKHEGYITDIIKLKNTYVCIIINESGNEIARYNIGETTPKSVLAKLDSIVINLGTELVVINQNGWIRKKYNSAKEISRYDISRIYDNSLV